MKVLIVNTLYYPHRVGGAEVSVQLLAESLVGMNVEVRVICLTDEGDRKEQIVNGVVVIYLPLRNIYWPFGDKEPAVWEKVLWHFIDIYNPMMSKQLEREIVLYNPDVVHTNNLAGFSVAVWHKVKVYNLHLVHTMRDYYLFHPNATLFKKRKNMRLNDVAVKFWSFTKKIASRKVDVAVGISEYVSKLHKDNGFFPEACSINIYNQVRRLVVKQVQVKPVAVGFIGRLTHEKGFNDFCDLAERYAGREMVFIAAGRFEKDTEGVQLEARADRLGIIKIGFVSVEEFLSQVSVVYLPIKWREPFGRTIVESALSGRLVFTTKVGGAAELFAMLDNVFDIEEFDSMAQKGFSLNKISKCSETSVFDEEVCEEYLNKAYKTNLKT
ncbi:glycosyltransferase [Halomonas sp. McH1-25]|uniref:glycosyltransferase n=1 Tax=unclassified Halomonas TaxID=2609666 RepID=UPI001EF5BEF4|nr:MULTISPECIES: glycosyltransferase [unclassified Halomonas]MCG7601030.1 glycosyltransferase [Halomonas sp. McH1-25]MCP1344649.1 glycosyltransferase [Halomonas sp. FL8]MCP1360590.1 glycosyltransferase [Halomonas sp. BBD45]MCP1365623.1 glycosyltransferase [Halomonas sp. BBD48]